MGCQEAGPSVAPLTQDDTVAGKDLLPGVARCGSSRAGHCGSGTFGATYVFVSASWYSPNSALMPSNSRFTTER
jgi:hypothetical protein